MNGEQLTQTIARIAGEEVAKAWTTMEERARAARTATTGVADRIIQPQEQRTLRSDTADKGLMIGWMAIALRSVNLDREKAAAFAIKTFPAGVGEDVAKALTAGSLEDGGALITPEHSQELIDLLRPKTIVRQHITNTMDVSAGMLDMPRITADAQVSWGGEIEEIRESQPAVDQLVMRAFQEKCLVPFSNTWLRRGGPRVASFVRNSITRAMAIGEDLAFLNSPGTEHRPKGLRWWAPVPNRLAASAWTGTAADKLTAASGDLGRLVLQMEQQNVPMTGAFWAMSPRSKMYLMTVRDSLGNYVFRAEMDKGTLWGWPYESSTQISNTGGTGANESTIFLTDGDEFILGQGAALQVAMSDQGTIVDVDGNVISLFQRNMSAIRVINEVDLKPMHAEATAQLTGVLWTP